MAVIITGEEFSKYVFNEMIKTLMLKGATMREEYFVYPNITVQTSTLHSVQCHRMND
jgi:hypothetical protein